MTGFVASFLPLLVMGMFLNASANLFAKRQALAGLLVCVGAIGYVGGLLLKSADEYFERIELPAVLETTTILADDGRRYSVTAPLERVQRYAPDGSFELGWFIDTGGGPVAIGLTGHDKIVVAGLRHRQSQVFEVDGTPDGPPRPFVNRNQSGWQSHVNPQSFDVQDLQLAASQRIDNPPLNWWTTLLFPFWHPTLAWILMVLGAVLSWLSGAPGSREPA